MTFALMIFGAMLLLQCAQSIPVNDFASSATSSSEEISDSSPHDLLLKEICSQFEDFLFVALRGISEVFESVIDEAEELEHPSVELKKHLGDLRTFINDVNSIHIHDDDIYRIHVIFNLASQMAKISDGYEEACKNHPEAFPASVLLRNNGIDAFKTSLVHEFLKFDTKFTRTFDAYIAGLTPESAKKWQKVIRWYNQYRNELNTGVKSDFLLTFLDLN